MLRKFERLTNNSRCSVFQFSAWSRFLKSKTSQWTFAGTLWSIFYLITTEMVELCGIEPQTSCVQSRRSPSWAKAPINGREDRIWTCDPLVPNQVHYQAVLLPVYKDGALGRNRTGTEFEVRRILSPVRLPVSPPGHIFGGSNRTWTDGRRVAVFCLTNLAMEPLLRGARIIYYGFYIIARVFKKKV